MIAAMNLENVKAVHLDVMSFLKTCTAKYDIIFADPPYNLPWLTELPDLVRNAGILNNEGFFILEHPGSVSFSGNPGLMEHRTYGSVNFSFFRFHYPV
jgi:16S rRNA G966 N2-methylase RsmD